MKKILIAAAAFLATASAADAQFYTSVGDKVTIGHSWTVGNRQDNQKYRFHPMVQVGRMGKLNFGQNVNLGLGTFFSTEGVTFRDDNTKITTEQRMNYIRIPLIATFDMGNSVNRVLPRISVGPSVGFLVGGKTLAKDNNDRLAGAKTTKVMNTKIDAGIQTALGINVKVAEGFTVSPDITYYHGLVKQEYNTGIAGTSARDFTNRNLGLSLGMSVNTDAMKAWKAKMHRR